MRSKVYIFKGHNLGLIVAISLLAVAVVSCWGGTPPLATPPALTPSPTRSTPTLQPTPSPTKIIKTPATQTPSSEAPCLSRGPIEEQAREALADFLGISSGEVKVIKVEEVEWPDTSLGCPEPGMVYAQVIVPGWRVVMKAGGKIYEYHCGGKQGVLSDEDSLPLPQVHDQQLDTNSYFPPPISTREIVRPPLE
jgi:hypothetical protein